VLADPGVFGPGFYDLYAPGSVQTPVGYLNAWVRIPDR